MKLLIHELSHVECFLEVSALLVCNIKSIVNSISFHGVPLRVLTCVSNIRVVDVPGISILHLERCLVEKLMRLILASIRSMWTNNFKCSVYRRLWNAVVLEVHESPSLTNQHCDAQIGNTEQASLTCSASWTISGLLKSISGIDIATVVLLGKVVLL